MFLSRGLFFSLLNQGNIRRRIDYRIKEFRFVSVETMERQCGFPRLPPGKYTKLNPREILEDERI